MLEQIKKSFRNYGTWVAILALIAFVLTAVVPAFDMAQWEEGVQLFLAVLIALGVISNPKSGDWFKDKEKDEDKDI